jgi:FkbM family methyltransferase
VFTQNKFPFAAARRTARIALDWIPPGTRVPILFPALWGKKWIVDSGLHGFWLGHYDLVLRRAIQASLQPGDVFYDVGANVGYYSLLASVLVGDEGLVLAFEPSRRNLTYLHQNLQINDIANVKVMEFAVGERSGHVRFHEETNGRMSHQDASGEIEVPLISLDDWIANSGTSPPNILKIDVVGSEMGVLRGASRILSEDRPVLFMQVHSFDLRPPWMAYLNDRGYNLEPLDTTEVQNAVFIRATPTK